MPRFGVNTPTAPVGVEHDLHELGCCVPPSRFLDAAAAIAEAGEAKRNNSSN